VKDIQFAIQVAMPSEITEEDIIASLEDGYQFRDQYFPELKEDEIGPFDLKRPTAEDLSHEPQLFIDVPETASRVVFGEKGARWLLSALATVSCHPGDIIRNIIVSENPTFWLKYGILTCRFYRKGDWENIIIDTRLPVSTNSSDEGKTDEVSKTILQNKIHPLFSRAFDYDEHWVALIEKAYAKMKGGYGFLCEDANKVDSHFIKRYMTALLELTGGSVFSIDLHSKEVAKFKSAQKLGTFDTLWARLEKYLEEYSLVSLMVCQQGEDFSKDLESGILRNHSYTIVNCKTLSSLKFVKIKCPWTDGEWKGDWSNNSDKWTAHADIENALMDDPSIEFNREANDGMFWMLWEDLLTVFDTMFVCRLFGDNYNQYLIQGEWTKHTAGGEHKLQKQARKGTSSKSKSNTESKFGTSIIENCASYNPNKHKYTHTLVDTDYKWFNNPQFLISCNSKTSLYISLTRDSVQVDDAKALGFVMAKVRGNRHDRLWELTAESAHVYSSQREFPAVSDDNDLREACIGNIGIDKGFTYVLIPTIRTPRVDGDFTLRIFSEKPLNVRSVPKTLKYTFESKRDRWSYSTRKDTAGGPLRLTGSKQGRNNPKWCHNPQYLIKLQDTDSGRRTTIRIVLQRKVSKGGSSGGKTENIGLVCCEAKSDADGKRLFVEDGWCATSDYSSKLFASLYLPRLSSNIGIAQNGILAVPTLAASGHEGSYSMHIFSDNPIDISRVTSSEKQYTTVLSGEWRGSQAGGCHLNPDWRRNPVYQLALINTNENEEVEEAKVRVTLSRPTKEWAKQAKTDRVGCMIGFYILEGSTMSREESRIYHAGKLWEGTSFVPMNEVSTPDDFYLEHIISDDDVYNIVPCTYSPNKLGPFAITVTCDKEFVLTKKRSGK